MSLSESRLAYEDCYEVMDKALEAEGTIRVGFTRSGEALFLRMRMNKARALDRKFNGQRYKNDHPLHLRSQYDALMFRVKDAGGMWWVYAERKPQRGVIEEIKPSEEPNTPVRQVLTYRRF